MYSLGRISTVKFQIDGKFIENVKHFTYLGITVSDSGCFNEARNVIYNKGMKPCFKMCHSFGTFKPRISTFFHNFVHTVKSVLMYGSEIWGTFIQKKVTSDEVFFTNFVMIL